MLNKLRIKYNEWKQKRLKAHEVDFSFRIGSSSMFMESFKFYLKQELAKIDADTINSQGRYTKLQYMELLNKVEHACSTALVSALIERGKILG